MSNLERIFAFHIGAAKLPEPEREYRFCERRWRFDFAWPAVKVALEVEGGHATGGRHTRPGGFEKDIEKYNTAALLGWTVLRATGKHVQSGQALQWVEELLKEREAA